MSNGLTISIEKLAHFQCPYCKGWWSVGDAPKREYWFCTWCGEKCLASGERKPMTQVWNPNQPNWTWRDSDQEQKKPQEGADEAQAGQG